MTAPEGHSVPMSDAVHRLIASIPSFAESIASFMAPHQAQALHKMCEGWVASANAASEKQAIAICRRALIRICRDAEMCGSRGDTARECIIAAMLQHDMKLPEDFEDESIDVDDGDYEDMDDGDYEDMDDGDYEDGGSEEADEEQEEEEEQEDDEEEGEETDDIDEESMNELCIDLHPQE